MISLSNWRNAFEQPVYGRRMKTQHRSTNSWRKYTTWMWKPSFKPFTLLWFSRYETDLERWNWLRGIPIAISFLCLSRRRRRCNWPRTVMRTSRCTTEEFSEWTTSALLRCLCRWTIWILSISSSASQLPAQCWLTSKHHILYGQWKSQPL